METQFDGQTFVDGLLDPNSQAFQDRVALLEPQVSPAGCSFLPPSASELIQSSQSADRERECSWGLTPKMTLPSFLPTLQLETVFGMSTTATAIQRVVITGFRRGFGGFGVMVICEIRIRVVVSIFGSGW